MKTFALVHAALLALPLYFVVSAMNAPLAGAAVGLAWTIASSLVLRGWRMPPVFESAMAAAFAGLACADLAGAQVPAGTAHAAVLGALGAGAAVSVVRGQPWTAEFAATEYGVLRTTPLFRRINMQISALWAALFAWLALALALELPGPARWVPLTLGGLASVLLPRWLIRRGLERQAAGDLRNRWPAPDYGRPARSSAAARAGCDVAVVGAGIGGLTAAALLADGGLRVEVFEQRLVPGGFAHHWLRSTPDADPRSGTGPGVFRFDSGVHDVSGWRPGGPVRSVFERLRIADAIEWQRLDHRYILDDQVIDVPRDWHAYVESLAYRFPNAGAGIRALFDDIHKVYTAMYASAGERGGIPGAPTTTAGVLEFARAHPLAVQWMERPWREFAARHVRDPRVLRVFEALGGYITDDIAKVKVASLIPIFGYVFDGGHYPVGGSGRIAHALLEAIEARGGRVHLGSAVQRIVAEGQTVRALRVRERSGVERTVPCTAAVCNGDLRMLTERLLADSPAATRLTRQIGSPRVTCSALGVNLGLVGLLDLPPIIHVADRDGHASLVLPSVVDPSCAPPGHSTVEILELIDHEEARNWFPTGSSVADRDDAFADYRRSAHYLDRKRALGDRLIDRASRAIPDLRSRIVLRSDATPLTYHRYAWTADGAIYGVAGQRTVPPTRTPLRNLVIAGAATHGPGIEAVLISGAYAAEALCPGVLRPAITAGQAQAGRDDAFRDARIPTAT